MTRCLTPIVYHLLNFVDSEGVARLTNDQDIDSMMKTQTIVSGAYVAN
jgi:hypothetical protein